MRLFIKAKSGKNCINWFTNELYNIAKYAASKLSCIKEIVISEEEELSFQNATVCYICEKKIFEHQTKVRDHSHITGKYRGPAHADCNLLYQESKVIPVVFHNLDYVLHFLIEMLSNAFEGNISIIPVNKDHYLSFTKTVKEPNKVNQKCFKFRFIDSFKFMATSLAKLASYLPKENFFISRAHAANISHEKFSLTINAKRYFSL